mmetsp:Transcript_8666/g.26965  ORF Transcript_8666/g.26965 Transcript_8666/m.26965 type:complete len:255 (-) Transcript_8666:155-919(-)
MCTAARHGDDSQKKLLSGRSGSGSDCGSERPLPAASLLSRCIAAIWHSWNESCTSPTRQPPLGPLHENQYLAVSATFGTDGSTLPRPPPLPWSARKRLVSRERPAMRPPSADCPAPAVGSKAWSSRASRSVSRTAAAWALSSLSRSLFFWRRGRNSLNTHTRFARRASRLMRRSILAKAAGANLPLARSTSILPSTIDWTRLRFSSFSFCRSSRAISCRSSRVRSTSVASRFLQQRQIFENGQMPQHVTASSAN